MHNPRLLSALPVTAILVALLMGGCIPDPFVPQKVATPAFSPAEGTFSDSVEVTINSSTDGAAVYYTLDGSGPTSSSTVYQDKLTLTETTTVKAIAYKDGMDSSDVATATFVKVADPVTLTITNPSAEGTLVEDEAGTLSVACTVTAAGTQVQSVTADLSQVGGSDAQALTANGNQWTWSGSVTPTSQGDKTITFSAAGSASETATATAAVTVAAAAGAPTITDASVIGTPTLDASASVTVQCTATVSSGTIQSVTADLSPIGGSASQSLSASGNGWSWTGNVTPTASGTQTITFTATGNGKTSNATATINVTTSQLGTLAGTWSGDVKVRISVELGPATIVSQTSTVASSVTFAPNDQPQTLPVCVGNGDQEVQLPTATLLNVGDRISSDLVEPKSGRTYAVSATVTAVSRSAAAFSINMDVELTGYSSPWTGTYTWTGTLGTDDSLTWKGTTNWDLGNDLRQKVTSNGALSRQ